MTGIRICEELHAEGIDVDHRSALRCCVAVERVRRSSSVHGAHTKGGLSSSKPLNRRRTSIKTIKAGKAPLDLNLLRVLLALDRTRHVTRAAELLEMSQSGFSSALSRLRSYTNDPLFVRTSGGMVPSPYGLRMIDAATAALTTIEDGILAQPDFDPGVP